MRQHMINADGSARELTLDLSFMGSLTALRAFDEGRADMAGFHVPIGESLRWDRTEMLRALRPRRDRVIQRCAMPRRRSK